MEFRPSLEMDPAPPRVEDLSVWEPGKTKAWVLQSYKFEFEVQPCQCFRVYPWVIYLIAQSLGFLVDNIMGDIYI